MVNILSEQTSTPSYINSPYIPTNLFYNSSIGLLNSWVHSLIKHLTDLGLKDLFPDLHNCTVKDPTPEKSQSLIHLFCTLIPQSSYPDWIQECFQKQMHPYDVIRQKQWHTMLNIVMSILLSTPLDL